MTRARAATGYLMFTALTAFSLGFVIFGTSAQSLSGLRAMCGCCGAADVAPPPPPSSPGAVDEVPPQLTLHRTASRLKSRRNMSPVDKQGQTVPVVPRDHRADRAKGQIALFLLFAAIIFVFVCFFVVVPLYQAPGTRDDALWRRACEEHDRATLSSLGLS